MPFSGTRLSKQYLTIPIRSDKLALSVEIQAHVRHVETPFQTIDVYDTEAFGRILTLDGHIQLTELDEGTYHEFLVHPSLLSMAAPESALVIGGGDGGVLREICKHTGIKRIDMAEIDAGVIEESKAHLAFVSAGAFDDPRVQLHVGDAFEFVKRTSDRYDLIVVDSTDVYEEEDGGLSDQLFTAEFYADCRRILNPSGFVVTQADNLMFCPYSLDHISAMFRTVFAETGSYFAVVPSFGGYSGYCWGSPESRLSATWPAGRADAVPLRFLTKEAYEFGMDVSILRNSLRHLREL